MRWHCSFFLFQRQPAFLHLPFLGMYLHAVSATSPEHAEDASPMAVGASDGVAVGASDGVADGVTVGVPVGMADGSAVGAPVEQVSKSQQPVSRKCALQVSHGPSRSGLPSLAEQYWT